MKKNFIVFTFLSLFSLYVITSGMQDLYKFILLSNDGEKAKGMIVDKNGRETKDYLSFMFCGRASARRETYMVEFEVEGNKKVLAKQVFCSSPPYEVGNKVGVIYSKKNPSVISIDGLERILAGLSLKLILGVLMVAAIINLKEKATKQKKAK
jgi:hypothetical protein